MYAWPGAWPSGQKKQAAFPLPAVKCSNRLGLFARVVAIVVVGVDDFVTLVLEFLANLLEPGANLLAVALHAIDPFSSQTLQLLKTRKN